MFLHDTHTADTPCLPGGGPTATSGKHDTSFNWFQTIIISWVITSQQWLSLRTDLEIKSEALSR